MSSGKAPPAVQPAPYAPKQLMGVSLAYLWSFLKVIEEKPVPAGRKVWDFRALVECYLLHKTARGQGVHQQPPQSEGFAFLVSLL